MADRAAELLAQLEETPDDLGLYLVLADTLAEAGDPRGDLIHVQHALAAEPERVERPARLRDRHGRPVRVAPEHDTRAELQTRRRLVERERHLIAQLRARVLGPLDVDVVQLDLRYGFITRAAVREWSVSAETYSMARALAAILAATEGRLIRTIEIVPRPARSAVVDESVGSVLAAVPAAPRSLRTLVLGRAFAAAPFAGLRFGRATDDLRAVLARFASVEELAVDLGPVTLAWRPLISDALRRFTWISPCVRAAELAPLAESRLPALEAFTLWTGAAYAAMAEQPLDDDELPAPSERIAIAELEPILAMLDRCPALRTLGIVNYVGDLGELVAAIAAHPLATRLETLDLARGESYDVADLRAALPQFPALREVRLEDTGDESELRAGLTITREASAARYRQIADDR